MKKYFNKFKGIFCLVMCLCIAIATFQVGVFAEGESTTPVTISSAKLIENKGSVFGYGILTGTADNGTTSMDDKCWNPETDENRGYDDSNANDIVRSFDVIQYNVVTTLNNLGGTAHKIRYQIEIPNDDALEVISDGVAFSFTKSDDEREKIYTFEWDVLAGQEAGGIEHYFSIKVGNKHQGDTITPKVSVYVDSVDNIQEVKNVKPVTVTTAPMYNLVLKKGNLDTSKNIYDFSKQNENFKKNAVAYKDKNYKVTGFRQVFGVALEIKKPGNGIKGVELPDSNSKFTFDIDLSNYTVGNDSATNEGFVPLLFYCGPNNVGGACVGEIPFTNSSVARSSNEGKYSWCDNSGTYTMTQEGDVLHVSVEKFSTDYNKFPKKSANEKISYGDSIEAMKDGFFSSFQFQVVYPYQNANGDTLMSKFNIGDQGTANATITVDNMYAKSETGRETREETIPLRNGETLNPDNDNTQSESFRMARAGTRDHSIIYSSRNESNWLEGYFSDYSGNKDDDIAAVGAKDLAFTVVYNQTNVGEADESSQIPLAIEQMVLFDRNAIELKKNGHVDLSNKTGYKGTYLYLRHKGGRLDAQGMKSAKLEEFDILTEPTDDCDGVLVRYQGCYNELNKSTLTQMTRFFCDIKSDYDLSDKVYMITAVTNTWDANDLTDTEKNQILSYYGKTSLDDITRDEYSNWIKNNDEINFFNRNHKVSTIDHRDYYTVPEYQNKIYNPSNQHQFSTNSADALYLVPYKVSIQKKVAQKDSQNGDFNEYNVSKKQRYVDYEVASQITFENDVTPPEKAKTTVYYTDTLPKGLTYIKDSAYLGGEYQSQFPSQGIVTKGEKIDPVVTENKDGTTTLTWQVNNVSLSKTDLDLIHYSCKIGDETDPTKDVEEGKEYKNDIKIQTDEDKRPYSSANDNEALASIIIKKDKEFYLTKTGKELLELEDNGYFDLTITNTSSNDKDDLFVVDTMPSDGDKKGTVMKGKYSLSNVSINKKLLNDANDFKLYYTNNKKYAGLDAENIKETDITTENGWYEAKKKTDGDNVIFSGDGLIGSWPTSIVYIDDKLEKNTIAKIRIEYDAIAAKDDHLSNNVTVPHGGSYLHDEAKVDIVKRSLEGTVWFDKDKNGKIGDADETRFKNVKVTLYEKQSDGSYAPAKAYQEAVKKADGTYEIISHPTTIETDENGHYKFDGLPEGDFKVVFESGDGEDPTDISKYDVTKFDQGNDEESSKVKDSNVLKENGQLTSGSILDIKMPSKEEMFSENKTTYNKPNQNLGLIIPSITISGEKYWDDQNNYDGLRPDSITLQIKNGDTVVKEIEVEKSNDWKWSIELPKYDDQDNEIHYTVEEKDVPEGYISTNNPSNYDITNTHTVTKLVIPVTKVWDDHNNQDGKRSDKVIVHLYANDKDTGKTLELNESNDWKASFTDLDQYENGNKIKYTIKEVTVKDYTSTITGNSKDGFIIKNKHTPETINIQGQKTWKDQDNQDGKRPENIMIRLYANGSEVQSKLVDDSTNWSYEFKDLDKYSNGTKINYEVKEDAVEGYTATIDGYNIINTHEVAKINIPVKKVWNDNDDNDHIRPKKVVVHLYANNKDTGKIVELSEDNQWNASFDDLDQYEKGKEIIYTVVEDEVKGYQVGITGSQDTGYILTNTHGLDTVEIKGTKTWDDHNDQDKMRPSKITVRLFADGQEIAFKEVTKDSKWIYDFGNLVKYNDGKEINYEVKEDAVVGYTTSIKGFDITNSHTPIPSKPSTDTPSKDDQNPHGDQSSNSNKTPEVKGKTEVTNKQTTNKIKTGDDTHILIYGLFVILSFVGIIFLKRKVNN